ncbi:hypothetical protein [Wukongibacter sp. M2B1]|uniref:hypothetical protein n=1 Tax=Wukongibacter sp. M2B1 TaxID=3088895 RepID=UPI003D7ACE99
MKFFRGIIVGIKFICSAILPYLTLSNIAMFILITITSTIFLRFIKEEIQKRLFKQKWKITRNKTSVEKLLVRKLSQYSFTKELLIRLSYKIAIFNKDSLEKNKEYAVILLFSTSSFIIVLSVFLFPKINLVWYIALFYVLIIIIFTGLLVYAVSMAVKTSFTKKLPKTFKVINSRLAITEDILEAIDLSKDDFDKSIRREMTRIYDCLRKNTKKKAKETFDFLEEVYRDDHFRLLTNLILQAYEKGVTEEVKKQFSDVNEDILTELEDQRDLDLVAKIYIGVGLLFPLFIKFVEEFNRRGLGDKADIFYGSPKGMIFKIAILVCILIYSSTMLILARNI